jgi:hypothetical protein
VAPCLAKVFVVVVGVGHEVAAVVEEDLSVFVCDRYLLSYNKVNFI